MQFHDQPNGPWLARTMPDGSVQINRGVPDAEARLRASQPTLALALLKHVEIDDELKAIRSASNQSEAERAIIENRDLIQKRRAAILVIRFLVRFYGITESDAVIVELKRTFGDSVVEMIFRETV